MSNWFHRFFNPHCEHCAEERHENKICSSCETLRSLLESERYEKKQLLDLIVEKNKPIQEQAAPTNPEPIRPRFIPWDSRRQMLEQEDRAKAKIIQQQKELEEKIKNSKVDVSDLEKEMGIIEKERENAK